MLLASVAPCTNKFCCRRESASRDNKGQVIQGSEEADVEGGPTVYEPPTHVIEEAAANEGRAEAVEGGEAVVEGRAEAAEGGEEAVERGAGGSTDCSWRMVLSGWGN